MNRSPRATAARNERGSAADRRRRREWVLTTYRADVDAVTWPGYDQDLKEETTITAAAPIGEGEPACRCYRCGVLLTLATLTLDRIIRGRDGGTYRRDNIRPACAECNKKRDSEAVPHH